MVWKGCSSASTGVIRLSWSSASMAFKRSTSSSLSVFSAMSSLPSMSLGTLIWLMSSKQLKMYLRASLDFIPVSISCSSGDFESSYCSLFLYYRFVKQKITKTGRLLDQFVRSKKLSLSKVEINECGATTNNTLKTALKKVLPWASRKGSGSHKSPYWRTFWFWLHCWEYAQEEAPAFGRCTWSDHTQTSQGRAAIPETARLWRIRETTCRWPRNTEDRGEFLEPFHGKPNFNFVTFDSWLVLTILEFINLEFIVWLIIYYYKKNILTFPHII